MMDYKLVYNNIISRAISDNRKKINKDGSLECHHIIPTCVNGENIKSNKVLLTLREHYVCHLLLVKIYHKNRKLVLALNRMSYSKKEGYKLSSRSYANLKELYYNLLDDHPCKGRHISDEHKKIISKIHSGKIISDEQKNKLSSSMMGNQIWLGKHHSEETKRILSEKSKGNSKRLGMPCSDEAKKLIGAANKGRPSPFKGKKLSEEILEKKRLTRLKNKTK